MLNWLIHIGLAKTATSLLQSKVLPGVARFVGKDHVNFPQSYGAVDLSQLSEKVASQAHYLEPNVLVAETAAWISSAAKQFGSGFSDGSIKVSDENLLHWPISSKWQHGLHIILDNLNDHKAPEV